MACPKTGQGVLVDPGDEPQRIVALVGDTRTSTGLPVEIRYILHTHGHLDHVGATRPVVEALGAGKARSEWPKVALHQGDEEMYKALKSQGSMFGLSHYAEPLPVDHFLVDGEELQVGELRIVALHTPGHSPGGMCFLVKGDAALGVKETVVSGDTLFQGSIGRTDLWGGDHDKLLRSIRTRLLSLSDETRVCPGHGPDSQIGIEKRENPFL
ncbi:MAG: MBL fold metallo-hydrolase [Oligoflexia bacterium]|nr:MBL fold metallo-hydrolase [Oligoflexia bacterium]